MKHVRIVRERPNYWAYILLVLGIISFEVPGWYAVTTGYDSIGTQPDLLVMYLVLSGFVFIIAGFVCFIFLFAVEAVEVEEVIEYEKIVYGIVEEEEE